MIAEPLESDPLGAAVDEFVEQYRRGQRPSIDEFAGMHPAIADELREMLATVVLIEEAKQTGQRATEAWAEVDTAAVTKTLEKVGDYRILRKLGRGGMGIVYEAEQVSLGRRVALKVLPAVAALDAKRLQRFHREARAAARLHHTNIVPVFEVGEAEGIHYFTMQYLPGHGLDKVIAELGRLREPDGGLAGADTRRALGELSVTDVALSLLADPSSKGPANTAATVESHAAAEGHQEVSAVASDPPRTPARSRHYWHNVARMGLQVAEALGYAHGQGMIHRDVKPSNLLLDVHGTVWLTDFGVAKQDGQEDLTESGDVVGTLRYMAPEATRGNADVRSDVYSLGLTLFELVGLVPARSGSNREWLFQQVRQGAVPVLRKFCPQAPPDLETIIQKAVAPEPERRYQTADEMAADLGRFMHDEPIHARRVTVVERLARWCRRNPAISVTAGSAVLAIAATVLAAFLFINAAKNRAELLAEAKGRLADENAALAQREKDSRQQLQSALAGEATQRRLAEARMVETEKAKDEQDRAARDARAVSDFLVVDMLGAVSPERNHGRQVTVREMLDRATRRVGSSFSQQPETEGAVREAIGRAYHSLGVYGEAHKQLVAALDLRRRTLGVDHLSTLKTEINLAATLFCEGKYAEGQKLQEKTLETLRHKFSPNHPQALESLGNLAVNLHAQGKYPQAQKLLEEVLDKKARILGPEHESTLATMSNLAVNLDAQEKFREGEELHRTALRVSLRHNGEQHPSTLVTMNNLAVNLGRQKRLAEAEKLLQKILVVQRRVLGPEHPETLGTINNLAVNLGEQGKRAEGKALLEELAAAFQRLLGPEHPSTITTRNNLAMNLLAEGRNAEVEKSLSETADISARSLGPEHPTTLHIMENLAQCLVNQGKWAEAEIILSKALTAHQHLEGPEHQSTLADMGGLARIKARRGKFTEAEKLFGSLLEIQRRRLGPEHTGTLITMNQLAGMHLLQKHYDEAQKGFAELLAIIQHTRGRENVDALHVMYNLGGVLASEGKVAEARQIFEDVATIQRNVLGPKHAETLAVEEILAGLRQGRTDHLSPRQGRPWLGEP